jgi:hydrogenase nickel incorporation protein HypA/HybF
LCPCGSSDVSVLAGTELLIKAVRLAPVEVEPDVRDLRV